MVREKAEQIMREREEEEGKKKGIIQNYRERTQLRVIHANIQARPSRLSNQKSAEPIGYAARRSKSTKK